MLGTRKPAHDATLTVLAACPPNRRERVQPVFDAVGSRTIWLDRPGEASRLKLVANAWVAALTVALAESLALAEGLDVDPQRFLDAIDGGPVDPPYAQIKGRLMLDDDYPTSFPVALARKDTALIGEAARAAGLDLAVATAVARRFADADDAGHGDADMAAVRRVV